MQQLLIVAMVTAIVMARPELYKEKEDFQYSRSSSDDGTKSGFYGAQRGNMGGNYEKAHNMDNLAQHQMSGLVRQVEGELGDGSNTRTGSVYSAANSRGIYGSGNYDLSNLQGRNFRESTSIDDLQSQSSLSSHNMAYSGRSSSINSGRSSSINSKYSDYQGHNGYSGLTSQTANLEALKNIQNTNDYTRRSSESSGYAMQSGYYGQSEYDQSNTNTQNYGNGLNTRTRLIGATPVRIVVRPGTRVAIPVAAQTYEVINDRNSANSEIEAISNTNHQMNYQNNNELETNFRRDSDASDRSLNSPKRYESSYSYRKEWEKHDTQTETILPTANPYSKNSEMYEDTQGGHTSDNHYHGASSQDSQLSHAYNGHNTKSSSSIQSQQQSEYNRNYQQSSLHSGSDSNLNTHGAYNSDTAGESNNLVGDVNSRPKSYQSSYSYHKSWEHQGDPYIIKPAAEPYDGSASQRLTSESQDQRSHSSHHYGSHYKQSHQSYTGVDDCDESNHRRIARSYNANQYHGNNENEGQESVQFQNGWEDLGQQAQNQFGQLEDLGQQAQNQFGQLEDLGQQSQNSWDTLEDNGQQAQHRWDTVNDLGQQVQTSWDNKQNEHEQVVQQTSDKIENMGQQTQDKFNRENEQTQNNWDKLENLGQQTQVDYFRPQNQPNMEQHDNWNILPNVQQNIQHKKIENSGQTLIRGSESSTMSSVREKANTINENHDQILEPTLYSNYNNNLPSSHVFQSRSDKPNHVMPHQNTNGMYNSEEHNYNMWHRFVQSETQQTQQSWNHYENNSEPVWAKTLENPVPYDENQEQNNSRHTLNLNVSNNTTDLPALNNFWDVLENIEKQSLNTNSNYSYLNEEQSSFHHRNENWMHNNNYNSNQASSNSNSSNTNFTVYNLPTFNIVPDDVYLPKDKPKLEESQHHTEKEIPSDVGRGDIGSEDLAIDRSTPKINIIVNEKTETQTYTLNSNNLNKTRNEIDNLSVTTEKYKTYNDNSKDIENSEFDSNLSVLSLNHNKWSENDKQHIFNISTSTPTTTSTTKHAITYLENFNSSSQINEHGNNSHEQHQQQNKDKHLVAFDNENIHVDQHNTDQIHQDFDLDNSQNSMEQFDGLLLGQFDQQNMGQFDQQNMEQQFDQQNIQTDQHLVDFGQMLTQGTPSNWEPSKQEQRGDDHKLNITKQNREDQFEQNVGQFEEQNIGQFEEQNMGQFEQQKLGQFEQQNMGQFEQQNMGPFEEQNMGQFEEQNMGQFEQHDIGQIEKQNMGQINQLDREKNNQQKIQSDPHVEDFGQTPQRTWMLSEQQHNHDNQHRNSDKHNLEQQFEHDIQIQQQNMGQFEQENMEQQFEQQNIQTAQHLQDFGHAPQRTWVPSGRHSPDSQQLNIAQQNMEQNLEKHNIEQLEHDNQQEMQKTWVSNEQLQNSNGNKQSAFMPPPGSYAKDSNEDFQNSTQEIDLNDKNVPKNEENKLYTATVSSTQPTTEKPGFWKSVSNKLSNAKNTVVSWFKS